MSELILVSMVLFGLFAEFIDGSLGMGYGVTSSSFIITLGVAPAIVSASVHTAEIFTTFFAGMSHWKFGNIRKDIAVPLIVPGVIGGILGATLLSNIPAYITKPVIALFLAFIGLIIFIRFVMRKNIIVADKPISRTGLSTLGFIAAFCDACAGGGWGPIATPTLIMSNKSQPRKVVGSVDASEFFVTIAETITFMLLLGPENFHWNWVLALIIGGGIAAPVAAYTCKRITMRLLGILVGLILLITNLRTLLNIFGAMV